MAKNHDIYYRVHAQNIGWMNWAKNGEPAGTDGFAFRIEALEAKIADVRAAQAKFATYSQEQVDKIFRAAAIAADNARISLAKGTLEKRYPTPGGSGTPFILDNTLFCTSPKRLLYAFPLSK